MKKVMLLSICAMATAVCSWAADPEIQLDFIPPVGFNEDGPSKNLAFTIINSSNISWTVTHQIQSGSPSLLAITPVSQSVTTSGAIDIVPKPHKNGTNQVQLTATASGQTSLHKTFWVNVAGLNDPVIISNLPPTVATIDTAAGTSPFSAASIHDADDGNPVTEELTLTVTIPAGNNVGTFAGMVNGVFTHTGSPGQVTAALQGLLFNPVENARQVGTFGTLDVDVAVEATKGTEPEVSGNSQISVESMNDPPSAVLGINPTLIDDDGSQASFSLSIEDPDPGETFTVTLQPDNPALGSLDPTPADFSGTLQQVVTGIGSTRYLPNGDFVSGSTNVVFEVVVTDAEGDSTANSVTLTITGDNEPPSISGVVSYELIRMDDDETNRPFSTVTISDPDLQGLSPLNASLTVSPPSLGILIPDNTNALTPAALTAWIRDVIFVPTNNAIPVGTTQTATLSITVDDSDEVVTNDKTQIAIKGVTGAPRILGMPATQPLAVEPLDYPRPFAGLGRRNRRLDDDHRAGQRREGYALQYGGPNRVCPAGRQRGRNQPCADQPSVSGQYQPSLPGKAARRHHIHHHGGGRCRQRTGRNPEHHP